MNRLVLFEQISEAFRRVFKADLELVYEISHNLVQAEDHPDFGAVWVHRKGATRAFPGGHPALAGTISPWATVASLPFAPEIVLLVLKWFHDIDLRIDRPYGLLGILIA